MGGSHTTARSATLKIKLIFFEIARKLLLRGPTTAIIIMEWRKKKFIRDIKRDDCDNRMKMFIKLFTSMNHRVREKLIPAKWMEENFMKIDNPQA